VNKGLNQTLAWILAVVISGALFSGGIFLLIKGVDMDGHDDKGHELSADELAKETHSEVHDEHAGSAQDKEDQHDDHGEAGHAETENNEHREAGAHEKSAEHPAPEH
jgi:hypothetical protein